MSSLIQIDDHPRTDPRTDGQAYQLLRPLAGLIKLTTNNNIICVPGHNGPLRSIFVVHCKLYSVHSAIIVHSTKWGWNVKGAVPI